MASSHALLILYTAHSKTNRYVLSRSAGPRARHSRLSMAASGSCSLACLGRKSYVSQRALSQVLQQIKELPELPSATSRRTLKRARDEKTQSCKTAYGEILCDFRCVAEAGVEIAIPVLHPAAMLAWATERCPPFGEMMERAMETTPPSFLQPWGLVWYSDEIGPGNQLKHSNKRKVQCIYWSMLPLGQHAMGCELCWFTLCAIRSSVVAEIGGMSVLFRQLATLFFERPDFRHGLVLQCPGQTRLLFADLKILISDEAAIKASLCNKGASGLIFCVQCQNAVDHKAGIAERSRGNMVPSLETDMSLFRMHTPDSIQGTMDFLQRQERILGKDKFLELQTAMGFNFKADGLLAHAAYGPPVIEAVMFDWLHIYLVNGIFNVLTGYFLGDLHNHGWKHDDIDHFANGFVWPSRLRGAAAKDILQKRKPSEALKCGASEALNFMQLLRVYVLLFVLPNCSRDVRDSCEVWLALCKVIDALQAITAKASAHCPLQLQHLIKRHLDLAKSRFGDSWWVPKCHLAGHLALQFQKHQVLLSCFVQERKHKIIKRITNEISDTSKAFEKSIIQDALQSHLESLEEGVYLPGQGVRLVEPVKPAPVRLRTEIHNTLQVHTEVLTARQAVHGGNFAVAAGDLALMILDGATAVGKVAYHVMRENCVVARDLLDACPWLHVCSLCRRLWARANPTDSGHMPL